MWLIPLIQKELNTYPRTLQSKSKVKSEHQHFKSVLLKYCKIQELYLIQMSNTYNITDDMNYTIETAHAWHQSVQF
jgi:predicted nucleic-acid-binding Zn-ribbon protein